MAEPERIGDILKDMMSKGFLQGHEKHSAYMARQEALESSRRSGQPVRYEQQVFDFYKLHLSPRETQLEFKFMRE